jgi:hypothetical protein
MRQSDGISESGFGPSFKNHIMLKKVFILASLTALLAGCTGSRNQGSVGGYSEQSAPTGTDSSSTDGIGSSQGGFGGSQGSSGAPASGTGNP